MTIFFLTQRLPYAPNRGDRIRAYFLLREMSRFADVYVFSLVHDDDEASRAGEVPFARGVAVARVTRRRNAISALPRLPSDTPLTHLLLDSPRIRPELDALARAHPPDLVVCYCSGVARLVFEPPLADIPFVLDMVDVDSAKWTDLGARARGPMRWVYNREARTLGAFERDVVGRAAATLVVNDREHATLRRVALDGEILTLENGIDVDAFAPPGPPGEAPVVVFCGVMNYAPNEQGVLWFAREVWPDVHRAIPSARFVVVGDAPTRAVRQLTVADASITVTGRVDTVVPYLWGAAAAVAPLVVARGVQNKVLEALAAGLPAVVTPAVFEGLPAEARSGCLVAERPADYAERLRWLLEQSPDERRALAARAHLAGLSWSGRFAPVEAVCRAAVRRGRT